MNIFTIMNMYIQKNVNKNVCIMKVQEYNNNNNLDQLSYKDESSIWGGGSLKLVFIFNFCNPTPEAN